MASHIVVYVHVFLLLRVLLRAGLFCPVRAAYLLESEVCLYFTPHALYARTFSARATFCANIFVLREQK